MMLKPKAAQENIEIRKHAIPALLLPVLFIVGVWGAGHYEVVGRGEGLLPTTSVPPSLLTGCAIFSVFYGALCLWLAKLSQKPADFLATFFVSVFAGAPFFIGFCTLTFAALALTINGCLDTSEPQTHRTIIQKSSLFVSMSSRGKRCSYYIVQAVDWRDAKRQVRLDLNPNSPNISKGSELIVTTRRGLLGYEWIQSIHS
jgi:hypothetical protein